MRTNTPPHQGGKLSKSLGGNIGCEDKLSSWDFFFFSNLTYYWYSRWTSISLPSCLWSLRIFPSLPGSRLTIFYRDARSALLQLVNQWLNFTYSRSHAFRYRKNEHKSYFEVRTELTTSALAGVQVTYYTTRATSDLIGLYSPMAVASGQQYSNIGEKTAVILCTSIIATQVHKTKAKNLLLVVDKQQFAEIID